MSLRGTEVENRRLRFASSLEVSSKVNVTESLIQNNNFLTLIILMDLVYHQHF